MRGLVFDCITEDTTTPVPRAPPSVTTTAAEHTTVETMTSSHVTEPEVTDSPSAAVTFDRTTTALPAVKLWGVEVNTHRLQVQ